MIHLWRGCAARVLLGKPCSSAPDTPVLAAETLVETLPAVKLRLPVEHWPKDTGDRF